MLLKELEEFAFKGIPDVRGCAVSDAHLLEEASREEYDRKLAEQRDKQQQLIKQLKTQLEDLETYAYEVCVPCVAIQCTGTFTLTLVTLSCVGVLADGRIGASDEQAHGEAGRHHQPTAQQARHRPRELRQTQVR